MNTRSIVKKVMPRSLFKKVEPLGHLVEAGVVQSLHGFPARNLKVIGVTGTDGKTTTCTLIASMLRNSGHKVALITTISIDYGDGKGPQPNPSPQHMTTSTASNLAKTLKRVKSNGVEWVVLETSSHALAQHRVAGVPYSIGVLTNITHEHFDYHGTFERYREAKRQLFVLTNRNKRGLQVGVLNADDPSAAVFSRSVAHPISYGVHKGDIRASAIKLTAAGSTFTATIGADTYKITCNLSGQFNVYNSLAAIGVGRAVGLSQQQIEDGIASLSSVPGRMMRIQAGQPFEVIVDYAVTPAALESVLKAAKATTKGKVMIIFGATGSRDKAKRPVMGEVVSRLADRIFLTDDETHTEDANSIRKAVFAGIEKAGGAAKCTVVNDRFNAIQMAVQEARAGDTLLLTGLGHQDDRNMGGKLIPWNDADVVTSLLQ